MRTRTIARRYASLTVAATVLLSLATATAALALTKPATFQYYDGNSAATAPAVDWDQVYLGAPGFDATTFTVDNPYSEELTLFTGGGSKDYLDIPNWAWRTVGQAPDKTDLLHVMSAKKGTMLYFAADRYATNGDAKVGFWILQDDVAPLPDGSFSGEHRDGDVMIESTFVDGGKEIDTINVYRWTDGALEPMGVPGGDCQAANISGYVVCATNNRTPFDPAWPYTQKASGKIPGGAFIEGAIDLSAIYGAHIPCFGSFLAETRSSGSSIYSELKDFAVAPFDTCGSLTIRKIRNAGSPNDTFDFTTGGTLTPDMFSLQGAESAGTIVAANRRTFRHLEPGVYTVSELEPAEPWVLTNIVCTGGTAATDGSYKATVTIVGSEDVVCTFYNYYNVVTTRTQGFWQTHPNIARDVWGASRTMCGLDVNATMVGDAAKGALMGGFWSNVANTTDGKKRSPLNKAKMTLLQQLLAAKLNATKWPPTSATTIGRIATAELRFCTSTSMHDVNESAGFMGQYNESGDTGIWSPGERATATWAKANANVEFWDILGRDDWTGSAPAAIAGKSATASKTTTSSKSSGTIVRIARGKAVLR